MVSYAGDSNLGDPIVAPFVTKATQTFTITPVDGQVGTVTSTPVSNNSLWGNVYGGVCSSSAS
jgi:simple sugar transport system substrate-binding protein/ribose transport system substrate-binding protein